MWRNSELKSVGRLKRKRREKEREWEQKGEAKKIPEKAPETFLCREVAAPGSPAEAPRKVGSA